EHLGRLNSSPEAIATRFSLGHPAHNKSPRLLVNCDFCEKPISLTQFRINLTKKHFCNPDCRNQGRESQATNRAVALYNSGLKLREVAGQLGYTTSTVSSLIYKSKLKRTHPRVGYGRCAVKAALPKSCELCGYTRTV